eukprot:TRINITY_DN3269_c0_g1_i11.p1 TRINITY_DN3269_c0_g1~~TRINITY_DN3269_c0_g1_i11.p1  ORF type:complete len:578 (-),score=118.40 TRINITY_DN3269_c0_g1_i11:57-1790(-)
MFCTRRYVFVSRQTHRRGLSGAPQAVDPPAEDWSLDVGPPCPVTGAPRRDPHRKEQNARYYHKHRANICARRRAWYQQNSDEAKRRVRAYQSAESLKNPKLPKNKSWRTPETVRAFFERSKPLFHIHSPSDWYRISRTQILSAGGGRLFNCFGSLGKALEFAYREVHWEQEKFAFRGKKSVQRMVKVLLSLLLPSQTDILEDYLHPELFWDEGMRVRMEVDIWVPGYQLALEYQGEHHYHDLPDVYGPTGTVALYLERDLKKRESCAGRGITLVVVPYWWDGKKESLCATLHQYLPDVFPRGDSPAIPAYPPTRGDIVEMERVESIMMHGQVWDGEQDPTGWYMSEKLDGFRAFWDGSQLYSKNGKVIPIPSDFASLLPRHICLDGELWTGYDKFNDLQAIFKKSQTLQSDSQQFYELWKDVKYCVFDAPMHPGNYQERHTFALNTISSGSNILILPMERCQGLQHLQNKLKEVTDKKGEGVMLYHPTATYTSGRTSHLQKVKAYAEGDVTFLKCNPNRYAFLCEQQNGETCIVKCTGWDYMFPPPTGTTLTVKHRGFSSTHKMKYPFLFKIRTNLE